jgi:rubredoxin
MKRRKNNKISIHNLFVCPECAFTSIERVTSHAFVSEDILALDFVTREYDTALTNYYVEAPNFIFKCTNCGYVLYDKNGYEIRTIDGLFTWFNNSDKGV